jgi:hypothetical protein
VPRRLHKKKVSYKRIVSALKRHHHKTRRKKTRQDILGRKEIGGSVKSSRPPEIHSIKGSKVMSRKKHRRGRGKRSHRMGSATAFMGFGRYRGPEARPAGHHRGEYMGGFGGKRDMGSSLGAAMMQAAVVIGGAVGGNVLANVVPIANTKIKSSIPLLLGIVLAIAGAKNKMLRALGLGMSAIGGVRLVREFVPNMPLLASEPAKLSLADAQNALRLGVISQAEYDTVKGALLGGPTQYAGADEIPFHEGEDDDVAGDYDVAGDDEMSSDETSPFVTTQDVG